MFHPHMIPHSHPHTQLLTKKQVQWNPSIRTPHYKRTPSSGPFRHSLTHTHTHSQESPSGGVGTQSRVKDGGSDLQRKVWTGWHYDAD